MNRSRKKALYIAWCFLNIILFLLSGNFISKQDSDFFPFPIYRTNYPQTYTYNLYEELKQKGAKVGDYENFFTKIQNDSLLGYLYRKIKDVKLSIVTFEDSTSFINRIHASIKGHGKDKFYTNTKYFPEGIRQYDYSEFIIYSLLPLVISIFIRNWLKKEDDN